VATGSQTIYEEALPHVREAAEHLLCSWDAAFEAEELLGCEVDTSDISDLCAGLDSPEDVTKITAEMVQELVENAARSNHDENPS
jgi:hypothetical protein